MIGTEIEITETGGLIGTFRYPWNPGQEYTKYLAWCEKHKEPVWLYDDLSYQCVHELIAETFSEDHIIVKGPWESS